MFDQGFRRRQADQDGRVEVAADARPGRASFDIPRRWGVDCCHGDLGLRHGPDDGWERFPDIAGEAEA